MPLVNLLIFQSISLDSFNILSMEYTDENFFEENKIIRDNKLILRVRKWRMNDEDDWIICYSLVWIDLDYTTIIIPCNEAEKIALNLVTGDGERAL